MKWIFAGTSHGVPEEGAFCSANFVLIGENVYIFDAGGPISPLLLHYGLKHERVKAIFISHDHCDHRDGLPEFLEHLNWRPAAAEIFMPQQEEIDLMRDFLTVTDGKVHDKAHFTLYHAGVIYDDGVLRVTARKNDHSPYAHSFLLETEGKRILHTGDLGYGFPDYERVLNGEAYDLVVCEAAHHDPGTVNDKLLRTNTKIMRLNHINLERVEKLTEFVHDAPFDCAFAYDGMILEL